VAGQDHSVAGRACKICSHPDRDRLDSGLTSGIPLADLAREYGVTSQGLIRHREAHLSKAVQAAAQRERQDVTEAREDSLLAQCKMLHRQALALMTAAYQARDYRGAIAGVGAATKLLELQGRFLGQIANAGPAVHVTLNDFRSLQVNIVAALEPYPEAKAAVLRALGGNAPEFEG
jgi:hypothetical protein